MFLLLLSLVFLGLFVGLVVGWMAEEELKPGMPYFEWVRRILLLIIIITFFAKNASVLFILMISTMIILFSFSKEREALYYSALSIILYLSWKYNGFAIIAPMVFLYGFPAGSIYFYQHSKDKKLKAALNLFLKHFAFLIIGLLFFCIELVL